MADPIADIARIRAAREEDRDDLIDVFLAQHTAMFTRISSSFCDKFGPETCRYFENILCLVVFKAWRLLIETLEDPDAVDTDQPWEKLLRSSCARLIREHLDRQVAPSPGATATASDAKAAAKAGVLLLMIGAVTKLLRRRRRVPSVSRRR